MSQRDRGITIVSFALTGACLGALCGYGVYSTFVSAPIGAVNDPEGRMAQGIGRAFEELRVLLIGLVTGSILGARTGVIIARRTDPSRRVDVEDGPEKQ